MHKKVCLFSLIVLLSNIDIHLYKTDFIFFGGGGFFYLNFHIIGEMMKYFIKLKKILNFDTHVVQ